MSSACRPWTCTRRPRTSSSISAEPSSIEDFASAPVTVPVQLDGPRRRGRDALAAVLGATLVGGIVVAGLSGPPAEPPTTDHVAILDDPASSPAPPYRTSFSLDATRSLVVTAPVRSGVEISTARLTVTGYVAGPPTPVRISLHGRGNRVIETSVVQPTRDAAVTDPQRVGRFSASFEIPNPRPNGEMLVEIALLAPDGHAFDVIWRYVAIGAVAPEPAAEGTRLLGEDGAMGGLTFRTLNAQPPAPATTDPDDGD